MFIRGFSTIKLDVPCTFETNFVSFEGHVRAIEIGTALDNEIDAHGHLLGHIASAGQVNRELFEGYGHVALDWHAELRRQQATQATLVLDGETVAQLQRTMG